MEWDDEVERLQQEVVARWGDDAVGGALLGALVDIQRAGDELVGPGRDPLLAAVADSDSDLAQATHVFSGAAVLRAYKPGFPI